MNDLEQRPNYRANDLACREALRRLAEIVRRQAVKGDPFHDSRYHSSQHDLERALPARGNS